MTTEPESNPAEEAATLTDAPAAENAATDNQAQDDAPPSQQEAGAREEIPGAEKAPKRLTREEIAARLERGDYFKEPTPPTDEAAPPSGTAEPAPRAADPAPAEAPAAAPAADPYRIPEPEWKALPPKVRESYAKLRKEAQAAAEERNAREARLAASGIAPADWQAWENIGHAAHAGDPQAAALLRQIADRIAPLQANPAEAPAKATARPKWLQDMVDSYQVDEEGAAKIMMNGVTAAPAPASRAAPTSTPRVAQVPPEAQALRDQQEAARVFAERIAHHQAKMPADWEKLYPEVRARILKAGITSPRQAAAIFDLAVEAALAARKPARPAVAAPSLPPSSPGGGTKTLTPREALAKKLGWR